MCLGLLMLTETSSSWTPETSTALVPHQSGCLAAKKQQRWSWRGWIRTHRGPVRPLFLPSVPQRHKMRVCHFVTHSHIRAQSKAMEKIDAFIDKSEQTKTQRLDVRDLIRAPACSLRRVSKNKSNMFPPFMLSAGSNSSQIKHQNYYIWHLFKTPAC